MNCFYRPEWRAKLTLTALEVYPKPIPPQRTMGSPAPAFLMTKEREGDLLNSHSKERLSCGCRKISILVCPG